MSDKKDNSRICEKYNLTAFTYLDKSNIKSFRFCIDIKDEEMERVLNHFDFDIDLITIFKWFFDEEWLCSLKNNEVFEYIINSEYRNNVIYEMTSDLRYVIKEVVSQIERFKKFDIDERCLIMIVATKRKEENNMLIPFDIYSI